MTGRTLSEDCRLHGLMMPVPDDGQCWYCARDAAQAPVSGVYLLSGDCATCGRPVPGGGHRADCTGLAGPPGSPWIPLDPDGLPPATYPSWRAQEQARKERP